MISNVAGEVREVRNHILDKNQGSVEKNDVGGGGNSELRGGWLSLMQLIPILILG